MLVTSLVPFILICSSLMILQRSQLPDVPENARD
jgi:hypothetical protein